MDDDSKVQSFVKYALGALGLGAFASVVAIPKLGMLSLWIILIVIVLALLLFGGYFWWQRRAAKKRRELFTSAIETQTAAAPKAISDPNKRANIGHFGSPELPPGPGYGNGTGGANGVRGTVASAGFGNGVAITPSSSGGPRGTVKSGGFATAAASPEVAKPKQAETDLALQPVVILAKPRPVYSDEARKLGLEGEVLVDVIFPASGSAVQVIRVTKGLGHGLDEAAIRAAQQIRFKPALQDGKPVDFPATVHIEFQIAY